MLSRLRIGTKLLLAPGVTLLLLVVLSGGATTAMLRQNASLETIVQQRAAHLHAAAELASSAQRAHAQGYQLLASLDGSLPASRIDPLARGLALQQAAVERGFTALAGLGGTSPAAQAGIEQARAAWRAYLPTVRDALASGRVDDARSSDLTGAGAQSKAERAFAVVAQRLAELAQREQELAETVSGAASTDFRTTVALMTLAVLLSIAISLAITMAVRRALLAGIGAIDAAARSLANGDLSVRPQLDGNDEIAATSRTLDAGIRRLNGNLRGVLDSARAIGAASREIGLGRAALPPRAGVRSANRHGADAMQAFADALCVHADSAHAARRVAQAAETAAQEGGVVTHRLVTSMEDVRRAVERLDRVGTLLEVTLEPAANPDAVGTSQVLVRRALLAVREARALTRDALDATEGGSAWAAQAGTCMAGLADAAREVDELVLGIDSRSREQARSLTGASQAVLRVDALNQQGTRLVEEAALAARTLQQQALDLSRAVAGFRLDDSLPRAGEAAAPHDAQERPGKGAHPYLRLASSRGTI